MLKAPHFTVVEAAGYVAMLQKMIPHATHRIAIAAMVVRSDVVAGGLLRDIAAAARRGVKVFIVTDVYAQATISRPVTAVSTQDFKAQCAETLQLFADITAAGGKTVWVGKVGLNPFRGRYHAKVTIVDDDVFSFGGVNFSDSEFNNLDYMLHAKDASLASNLQELLVDNARGLPAKDLEIPLGTDGTLLFDAGLPGTSIIYERACQLAGQAQKVTYISQMAPTGKLAALLRKTHTVYYANRPSQSGWHPSTLAQLWDQKRNGLVNHYQGSDYIHAKVILYELKNGSKAIISGSHNFSWRGVAFGTKEIALCSTDPGLWRSLHDIVYKVATADGSL